MRNRNTAHNDRRFRILNMFNKDRRQTITKSLVESAYRYRCDNYKLIIAPERIKYILSVMIYLGCICRPEVLRITKSVTIPLSLGQLPLRLTIPRKTTHKGKYPSGYYPSGQLPQKFVSHIVELSWTIFLAIIQPLV